MAKEKQIEKQDETPGFIVVSYFRDINDFSNEYQPGEDVSHFDKKRLEVLVQNNMVEAK